MGQNLFFLNDELTMIEIITNTIKICINDGQPYFWRIFIQFTGIIKFHKYK